MASLGPVTQKTSSDPGDAGATFPKGEGIVTFWT